MHCIAVSMAYFLYLQICMVLMLDGNSEIGANVVKEQSLLFDLFKVFD